MLLIYFTTYIVILHCFSHFYTSGKPAGRYFPISFELNALLNEISQKQRELGIDSAYVICDETGDSLKTPAYETGLRRLCQSLGFDITNNHAFRMTLNSLVLIPAGFTVTERASMLGHSVQTNLMYYSFDPRDSELEKADRLNSFLEQRDLVPVSPHPQIVDIRTKKSLKPCKSRFERFLNQCGRWDLNLVQRKNALKKGVSRCRLPKEPHREPLFIIISFFNLPNLRTMGVTPTLRIP